MKKLMVAAVAAAMTAGAFAGACDDGEYSELTYNCLVYNVQLKLKTLAPKRAKCYEKDSCGEKTACGEVYYLDNGSRTIKGYMWFCDDLCWDTDDDVKICLWDAKNKLAVIPLYYANEVKDGRLVAVQYPETFNFDVLGRYAKKANRVAAYWALDADTIALACAGINGTTIADKEMGTVTLKSISGNCAGMMDISTITIPGKCGEVEEFTAKIAELCDCWDNWCDDGDDADAVPVTGTWQIKYNKGLSKERAKSMLSIVPSYALELEA